MRRTSIFFWLAIIIFSVPVIAHKAVIEPPAKIWQVAPPPPIIADSTRQTELSRRRAEVLKRVAPNGMMILFSAEPRLYTNDVDYPYRQENNLYYLTGINQNNTTLVLIPSGKTVREILFIPKRNPQYETWNGRMLAFDEARKISGIQEVWDAEQFNSFLTFLAPRVGSILGNGPVLRGASTVSSADVRQNWASEFQSFKDAVNGDAASLYLLLPSQARENAEYRQEQQFAAKLAPTATGLNIKSGMSILAELRQIKSDLEIKLMQQAVDISIEAFNRAFAVAAPGLREYEIQAEFEYTYRKRNAFNWGYPCIVGGGANATTLHYISNQETLPNDGLLLMDCAAEFDHYTADITRTIPVNGKFNSAQADLYRIVYEAQEESIKLAKAGATKTACHQKATEIIKEGLLKVGLITSKNNDEYRLWFMHGTSHWLGMNVHDVGTTDTLAPGMILTVEPGIYIRPDALDYLANTPENEKFKQAIKAAFEKYKGIGVRIEDDILVTKAEPRVMSDALPRKLEEVEAFMARLKQQLNRTGLP